MRGGASADATIPWQLASSVYASNNPNSSDVFAN
jgi:hypothetical protein